ncbi:MAG: protein kinase [Phycisphaerales bacterium]|nr:MAG: protein kinase [Phycisphaerales bacterium]
MSDQVDNNLGQLPTVSGPTSDQGEKCPFPPPHVKGYEIVSAIGEAGQGRVWRAIQLSTNREVALKVPRIDLLRSQKALARFGREVELMARLNHPNVAQIYDSGMEEGLYYYAMELIEGVPLNQYAHEHRLSARGVLALMQDVCEAVEYAHRHGVIHRDIKPSNVLVTEDGQPHVLDFGLATTVAADDAFRTLSEEGEVTGTPAYMSPEQAAGHHRQLDTRADVYSLGVVLYELLTGALPYDVDTSMADTLHNILSVDPVRPSRVIRSLDRDIDAMVLKALAKEPDERYQSVAELRGDIDRWLAGQPLLARSYSSLYLLRKVIARHRYTSAVVLLLVLIVLGFLGVSLQLMGRLQQSNRELQGQREQLTATIGNFTRHAQSSVFAEFLKCWHSDQVAQAALLARPFGPRTREAEAVRFLQDDRPLTEKIAELKNGALANEPCFAQFLLAEHYLKDGNWSEAEKAYRECLSEPKFSQEDPWLTTWVKGRLYELSQEDDQASISHSGVGGGS